MIAGVPDETQKKVLTDFISSILGTVDADTPAKRRTLEAFPRNGIDFEKKFREYEEQIESLRDQLDKQGQARHASEDRLDAATKALREEQEMNRKLMRTLNEMTEATQGELLKEKEALQHTTALDLRHKEEEIKGLREELEAARAQTAEAEAQRTAVAGQLAEAQGKVQDYAVNWVRKEEWDRLFEEKVQRENRFAEVENRLAIEMAKSATYEAQIEKFKGQLKTQTETESRLRLEVDQLSTRVVSLNNEVRMLRSNRKGSLSLAEEARNSGNLDIEESGFSPITYSKVEDDVTRRIEEMERAHLEVEANLKAKVRELLTANEALNHEVLRLKDENSSIKADSFVLKKSSVAFSQREVSKFKRTEVSEEMLERLLNYETLNKRLKEESGLLQGRLADVGRSAAAANGLVYSAVLGYLSQDNH